VFLNEKDFEEQKKPEIKSKKDMPIYKELNDEKSINNDS
jgi:hypothetical protein